MCLCVTTSVRRSASGFCMRTSKSGCESWYVGVYVCSPGELEYELRGLSCDRFECVLRVRPISGCLILFLRIQVLKLICCVTGLVFPHILKECNTFLKCWGGQRRMKRWTPQTLKMKTKCQYSVTHWHSIVSQRTSIHIKINVEAPNLTLLLLFLILREGAVFRVYVVMPLLPGFEGEVGSPSGTALHAITHWNYASICRYVLCPQATYAATLRPRLSFPHR